jgi:thymidylate synthase (FAD)
MRIIDPSHEIVHLPEADSVVRHLELAARTCYKSEDRMTPDSGKRLLSRVIASGHESVIEHTSLSVRLTCDRGITHEIVRHRLCSFSQESSRYCRYGNGITVVRPANVDSRVINCCDHHIPSYLSDIDETSLLWCRAMSAAETSYIDLLNAGWSAQEARSVLPTCLKTEIVVTANIREWRHIFNLRCAKPAHPEMRRLMLPLLLELYEWCPLLFQDLFETFFDTRKEVVGHA